MRGHALRYINARLKSRCIGARNKSELVEADQSRGGDKLIALQIYRGHIGPESGGEPSENVVESSLCRVLRFCRMAAFSRLLVRGADIDRRLDIRSGSSAPQPFDTA